jgi:hypothetical protein
MRRLYNVFDNRFALLVLGVFLSFSLLFVTRSYHIYAPRLSSFCDSKSKFSTLSISMLEDLCVSRVLRRRPYYTDQQTSSTRLPSSATFNTTNSTSSFLCVSSTPLKLLIEAMVATKIDPEYDWGTYITSFAPSFVAEKEEHRDDVIY